MRTLTVEVQGRPPTPNSRRHWRVIAKDNDLWSEATILAAEKAMRAANAVHVRRFRVVPFAVPCPWPLDVAREAVTMKRTGRVVPALWRSTSPMLYVARYAVVFIVSTMAERDWDNLVASSKPLTDGLVRAGVIAGDSTRFIDSDTRTVTFRHMAGLSKVILSVEEGLAPGSLGL